MSIKILILKGKKILFLKEIKRNILLPFKQDVATEMELSNNQVRQEFGSICDHLLW